MKQLHNAAISEITDKALCVPADIAIQKSSTDAMQRLMGPLKRY
jgi:hypothetical protein